MYSSKNLSLLLLAGIVAVSTADCNNDGDVLQINIRPVKDFFVNPTPWGIAVICIAGVLALSSVIFMIRNCRITCDRQSRDITADTNSIGKNTHTTELDCPDLELGTKNEDEKYVPNASFRLSATTQPIVAPSSRSPSLKSQRSQATANTENSNNNNNNNVSKIVSDLIAEGMPILIIQSDSKNRPASPAAESVVEQEQQPEPVVITLPRKDSNSSLKSRSASPSRVNSMASRQTVGTQSQSNSSPSRAHSTYSMNQNQMPPRSPSAFRTMATAHYPPAHMLNRESNPLARSSSGIPKRPSNPSLPVIRY